MFCGKINSSKFKLQDLCHQIEWTVKINQRVPTANLWIINYCILEVKVDNEPAVGLLVYFKSVKKWKCFTKKTNKQKDQKKPSSPFHINAILELAPFLSQKSEEMQFARAFCTSTAKTGTVTSSFYFMILIRTVPPFNEKKKNWHKSMFSFLGSFTKLYGLSYNWSNLVPRALFTGPRL